VFTSYTINSSVFIAMCRHVISYATRVALIDDVYLVWLCAGDGLNYNENVLRTFGGPERKTFRVSDRVCCFRRNVSRSRERRTNVFTGRGVHKSLFRVRNDLSVRMSYARTLTRRKIPQVKVVGLGPLRRCRPARGRSRMCVIYH